MKNDEISEYLQILRTPRGIILTRPDEQYFKYMPIYQDTTHTVKSVLQLPCNIYFSDLENRYQLVNDSCATICGFDSAKAAHNKTILNTAKNNSSKIILANNNEVMRTQKSKIVEEELVLNSHALEQGLSIKLPYYNAKEKLCGIFGITIIFGKHKLDHALSYIAEIGLLNKEISPQAFNINDVYFTNREKQIIYLLIRNKSSKEMGNQLNISSRTIEKHIENIKYKLNVNSKSDIINKILENQH